MDNADVFLSYAPADQARVDALVDSLLREEYEVASDEGGQSGPLYQKNMNKKIAECKVFLLLLSREALADARVKAQLAKARELKRMVQAFQIEDLGASDPQAQALDDLDKIEAFGTQDCSALEKLLKVLRDAGVERRWPKIFISYSSEDSERVHRLAQHLREARRSVWIDRNKLTTGAHWDTQIVPAIRSCKIVIFARTEHSLKSSNVADELKLAKESHRHILQLRLSGPIELPDHLALLLVHHHFFEAGDKPDDVVFDEVLDELNKLDAQVNRNSQDHKKKAKKQRRARLKRYVGTVVPALLTVAVAIRWRPWQVWAGETILLPPAAAVGLSDPSIEVWHIPELGDEKLLDKVKNFEINEQGPFKIVIDGEYTSEDPELPGNDTKYETTPEIRKKLEDLRNEPRPLEARLYSGESLRGRYRFGLVDELGPSASWDTSYAILLRVPSVYIEDSLDMTIKLKVKGEESDTLATADFNSGEYGSIVIGQDEVGINRQRAAWRKELDYMSEYDEMTPGEVIARWGKAFSVWVDPNILEKKPPLVATLTITNRKGPLDRDTSLGSRSEVTFDLGKTRFVDKCVDEPIKEVRESDH